jgi:hypothetical protein
LNEHRDHLEYRWNQYQTVKANIEKAHGSLEEFAKVGEAVLLPAAAAAAVAVREAALAAR